MIYENEQQKKIVLKPVKLPLEQLTLETVAGRDSIAEQIEDDIDAYCVQAFDDGPRSHLGASVIGHECERYLWFAFRWMKRERFDGRKLRLFNRGHLEEARIIQWLTGIGFEIIQVDPETGKQLRTSAVAGHFGGSCDGHAIIPERYGLASGSKLLVEFKTSGSKYFPELKGKGVQKANSKHWTQLCVYGFKFDIEYALYICVNKDDDDLDVEVLKLDWSLGEAEINKAEKVINSYYPPPRISEDASFFKCKWCPMNQVCHLGEMPEKNCRSCKMAQPIEDGQWRCHQYNAIIPVEAIKNGCDVWQPIGR